MPRKARLVVPNYPHHVTQRGNRKQAVFFCEDDYRLYQHLLVQSKSKANVEIWGYCLMPNHVHFVVTPNTEDGIRKLFQEAHRRYTKRINERQEWLGHLWQERFHSCVMDETHLLAAVRYIELNPVRAGLCDKATDWPWSSVHAHLSGTSDGLVDPLAMRSRISDWHDYLSNGSGNIDPAVLSVHARSGRPIGDDHFLQQIELLTGQRRTI